ncbi:hypothetical protein P8C59_006355 [Phyllachora maydis]|uniref:Uncharacterized protein n=1 Tax=Phyllachora maydis TaxID=1825666 RepID=A0AAD9I657_9PEZI|nr:hypothetical protein P8C59_006355 [Phyllachora maydis]
MASDDDYMNFLDKANSDPSEGVVARGQQQQQQQQQQQAFKATGAGVSVPEALAQVARAGVFYTSDADEPFEPVALAWDEGGKRLPDEVEFAGLIEHGEPAQAEVEIMDPADWDGQGQYQQVTDAVRKAGRGNDVKVYRVARDGVRAEYWVVTTEGKGKEAKLVGLKALAVES